MIPKLLEELILAGKAKSDILTHVGGSYGSFDVEPDKIMIIWGLTLFPFYDQKFNGQEVMPPDSSLYTLTFNSEASREVIPFKFSYGESASGKIYLTGSAIFLNVYSIHRGKCTFDIRRFDPAQSNGTVAAPNNEGEQPTPFGSHGLTVTKTIDPLGIAATVVNFNTDLWKNNAQAPAGANLAKFEVPADNQSQIVAVNNYYAGTAPTVKTDNFPVLLFNCVFCNSSNFSKILVR
jgi:hypothetical protein